MSGVIVCKPMIYQWLRQFYAVSESTQLCCTRAGPLQQVQWPNTPWAWHLVLSPLGMDSWGGAGDAGDVFDARKAAVRSSWLPKTCSACQFKCAWKPKHIFRTASNGCKVKVVKSPFCCHLCQIFGWNLPQNQLIVYFDFLAFDGRPRVGMKTGYGTCKASKSSEDWSHLWLGSQSALTRHACLSGFLSFKLCSYRLHVA